MQFVGKEHFITTDGSTQGTEIVVRVAELLTKTEKETSALQEKQRWRLVNRKQQQYGKESAAVATAEQSSSCIEETEQKQRVGKKLVVTENNEKTADVGKSEETRKWISKDTCEKEKTT